MSEHEEAIRLLMELRRQGITDKRVLTAIETVPREAFVADVFRAQAWDNKALPIAQGQTISQPFIVAYMTQHLGVGERMTVLEIGTGSGYQTAVLAQLARRVYSIERFNALSVEAKARLDALGIVNATLRVGDGLKGWPQAAPFDRIILTAWVAHSPSALVQQLKMGGILIMPFGESSDSQRLVKLERTSEGSSETELIPVRFVPALEGVAREP
jgi:protein-L-isoaspartate(D-aspartate) O-methyltransferase